MNEIKEKNPLVRKIHIKYKIVFFVILALIIFWNMYKKPTVSINHKRSIFHDRLIIKRNNQIIEVSRTDSTQKVFYEIIADSALWGFISPDNRYLLYSNNKATLMRDLTSNQVRNIFPNKIHDVAWSPDSKRFSYKLPFDLKINDNVAGEVLLVYQLSSSSSKIIWEGTIAQYGYDPHAISGEPVSREVCSAFWLSADKLIFQRHLGDFPLQWKSRVRVIPANTTSLAIIGDSITFINSSERWWFRGISKDNSLILLSKARYEHSPNVIYTGGDTLYITPNFPDFEHMNIRRILYGDYESIGFIPGTSRLFYDKYGDQEKKLYLVNSRTLEIQSKFNIISLGGHKERLECIMDETENLLAYNDPIFNIYDISRVIRIFDLTTRRTMTISEGSFIPKNQNTLPLQSLGRHEIYYKFLGWIRQ